MNGLAVILLIAAAGFGIARWSRMSVIPVLILAGSLAAALGWLPQDEVLADAFELALAFLVFSAGMELNPERFRKHLGAVLWVGTAQFVGVAAAGFLLAKLLGFEDVPAAYLALALSTSSTLVVVQHLKQQQQLFEPFGRLVLGVLLLQDVVMILIIVTVGRWPQGAWPVLQGLGTVGGLAAMAVGCQQWLMPWVIRRLRPDEETLLLLVLALLFVFVSAAHLTGVSPVAGAFFAGFALARFPVNGVARGQLLSFNDFFQAIFFTALGGLVVVSSPAMLLQAAVLAFGVWWVTPPLVGAVAEWRGMTTRPALESGLLLAQTSEFALVLGFTGTQVLEQIPGEVFSLMAMVAVLTMTLTPFVATDRFTTLLLHLHPRRRRGQATGSRRGHVLMLGFGAGGMWMMKPVAQAGHDVLVVDDDPAVIEQLEAKGIPCLRGDGSDEHLLARAGAREAKLILVSMRRVQDARRVLDFARQVPVVVRVFEETEAVVVRRSGGIPVLNSEAAADTFMEWFGQTIHPQDAERTERASPVT
ncbi:MAG: cation:proton antiporter [Verrucomicrobiales bacterium]|nr:cation:proton antiporter [Verrucomicrobiales bacterium]MCP5526017.1 cation:proton antiporter [Verrucomicrobiales bacterium]